MKSPTTAQESFSNYWDRLFISYFTFFGGSLPPSDATRHAYLAGHAAGEAKAREEFETLNKELSDLRSHMSLSIEMREGK